MFTKLVPAIVLASALAQTACSESINPSLPTDPGNPVTETFTGTLTRNGADTRPFSVSRSGSVTASIATLAKDADSEIRARLAAQDARIRARYQSLSDSYQSGKDQNAIPLN